MSGSIAGEAPCSSPEPPHTPPAGNVCDSLQALAALLASDPLSNMDQLPALHSALEAADGGQHQLQCLAEHLAGLVPSAVFPGGNGRMKLDIEALKAMVTNAHDSNGSDNASHDIQQQSGFAQSQNTEQSRLGLVVLLLGVWAQRLVAASPRLQADQPSKPAEEAEGASSSSTAAVAESASPSAAEAAEQDATAGRPPQSSSRSVPCWADHMSLMASDGEEGEEEQAPSPDFMNFASHSSK